ncbi:MAG TPA: response regulator transcription factor [Chloroflexi bacterium]|nr:response regulator transcription factor [Chloroflexota bacterium]
MRILLANQYPETRLALTLLFGREPGACIVGSVGNAAGLLALAHTVQPDIVILDLNLPGAPVAETLDNLRFFNKSIKILLISAGLNPAEATQSPRVDAAIDHSDPPEVLLEAFHALRESNDLAIQR